jgi:cell division protease FtsH
MNGKAAARALVEAAENRAIALLKSRRMDLERGVELLLSRETLSPADFPPLRKPSGKPVAA